jgi:hypothetical protein
MQEQRTKRIEARIKPSLYKKVEKEAKANKWSISGFIEEALLNATYTPKRPREIPTASLRKMLKVKI